MKNESLWKNKNFTLTFLGALVSNIGAVLYSFAVSFYILKITDNNSAIQGAYLAVVGVVSLLVILFGGVFADRYNKAKIMYICDYLKGILLALSTVVMLFSKSNTFTLVILFIVGVVGSVISSIFTPASSSILPEIVSDDDLKKAHSYFSILQSVQSIAGILLAGILYSALPITALFFIVAGCYIASGVSEMFIRINKEKKDDNLTLKKTFADLKESFKYIFKNKPILYILCCALFINFFFNPVFTNFIPVFISSEVSGSAYLFKEFMSPEMWTSVIEIASAIGIIIGSLIIGAYKYKKASNCAKLGVGIICLLMIGLSLSYFFLVDKNKMINPTLIILTVFSFVVGLSIPVINVPLGTTLQKITDKDMLGKVEAASNLGSMGLTPLGTLLAGFIISGAGSSVLLFVCAGGFVITTIFLLISKRFSSI